MAVLDSTTVGGTTYELRDTNGRKLVAKDWDTNSTDAFAVGEYVVKDGIVYRFISPHTAEDEWSSSEVVATNIGAELRDLKSAITSGTHEDLTSGNAFEVLSDRGDADIAPYVFRKTGGAKKAYNREMLKKIVGGTVAWNQAMKEVNIDNWFYAETATISNGEVNVSPTASWQGCSMKTKTQIPANHICLITLDAKVSKSGDAIQIGSSLGGTVTIATVSNTSYIRFSKIFEQTTVYDGNINFANRYGVKDYSMKNFQLFDLTQMFGSTIADAIYAMEQATAGSGVAFFRSLFPNDYYDYAAVTLMSVQAGSKVTTGFNQFDKSHYVNNQLIKSDGTLAGGSNYAHSDYIRILPNTTYYTNGSCKGMYYTTIYYDNSKTVIDTNYSTTPGTFTTPSNAYYCIINTIKTETSIDDLVLNFHSNSGLDGTYEPYEEHVYPLDSDLVLRGIPKWDSTNGLYYDGDEYKPDGSVKRKYGIVDLGTLTWVFRDDIYFMADIPDLKTASGFTVGLMCQKYPTSTMGIVEAPDKVIRYRGSNHASVFIKDSSFNGDASAFKTAMSGVYLVYELKTPTTETADPYRSLQICNRYGTEEFVDAGVTASTPTRDVSIPVGTDTFYPVNVFDYIEELTQPDHDMVADANIVSGKYFMVGNSLYLSTQAIAQGAAIVPGTNCTAISLAEALNLINQ